MTPNKEKLLAALLTSRTKKEAAAAAGISDRTMRSYFEDKEFCQRYREAFAGVVQDATRRAQQLLEPALSTLQTVMEDEEIPAQARITAAKSIIDYSLKLTEQTDILEQLRELEEWREELNANR
jgi:AcrR family transcriptional regulator